MKNWLSNFIAKRSKSLREGKIEQIRSFLKHDSFTLDVGVWCKMPEPNPSENWLEKKYAHNTQIVAVGLDNMNEFKKKYPRVLCVQANGCALPFKEKSFIVAFSNAVLEHVPVTEQPHFVEEISRVVTKKALIAVPDRFSPIEIHSRIFFLHWLPFWRKLSSLLGEKYWSSEIHLSTLFTKRSLGKFLKRSSISGRWTIQRQTLFFMPVSLIAIFNNEEEN